MPDRKLQELDTIKDFVERAREQWGECCHLGFEDQMDLLTSAEDLIQYLVIYEKELETNFKDLYPKKVTR